MIIIVINGGGGMGADNQRPPPHAPDGWPADNVMTIVVRFPPSSTPPRNPVPSSASLFCRCYRICCCHGHLRAGTPRRITHLRPPTPIRPIPTSSAIMLANSSLDSVLRNASAIYKLVEGRRLVLMLNVSVQSSFFALKHRVSVEIRWEWIFFSCIPRI
jgi:hypothetical protein